MIWVLFGVCLVVAIPSGLRWLRVAQREHYLPGSVGRISDRWWGRTGMLNLALSVAMILTLVAAITTRALWTGLVVGLIVGVGPVGLSTRGSSSVLAWTRRLVRLAVISASIIVSVLLIGAVLANVPIMVLTLMLLPRLIDLALLILKPVERRLGSKWVDRASRKLKAIGPEVVAITGSYGKTTTKGYVAHLLGGSRRVVASPASFNNRMGLARAINENLTPGTQVFVAEMGTYSKGEIADLCNWVTPRISAMVSIGPVHLERFRTEERIVIAKSEILDRAEIGVICVDHPLLATLATERSRSMEIIEVGTATGGRVVVADGALTVDGLKVADVPGNIYDANLAVAVGVALASGLTTDEIAARIVGLPPTEHRLTTAMSEVGFTIIDDTFNSNPEGARRALGTLTATGSGRKVLVTPGMVELGPIQTRENMRFASDASKIVDDLVIVGRTNRSALRRGSASGRATVTVVGSRDEAVEWVRENLGPGDTVLYENDLPDHYP